MLVKEIVENWETERNNDWYAVDEITTDGRLIRLTVDREQEAKDFAAKRVTGFGLVDYEGNLCEPGEFGDMPFFRCQLVSAEEALAHFEKCLA